MTMCYNQIEAGFFFLHLSFFFILGTCSSIFEQIVLSNRIFKIVSISKNILQKRMLLLIIRFHCFLCTDHYVLQLSVCIESKHCSNSNICVIITTNEKGQITKQIITWFFISSEIEQCRNFRQNGTCSYIIFDESTGVHIYLSDFF